MFMESLFLQYGYWILFPLVIIEWPITILVLSLSASKLGLSFEFLFMLSIFGDLWGDIIHYVIWMYSQKKIAKYKKENNKYLVWIEKKLHDKSLLDMLIVIKYFPPVTSLWLLFIWYKRTDFKKFLLINGTIVLANSLFIVTIGYFFGHYFLNSTSISHFITGVMISFAVIYFTIKYVKRFIVKKITNDKIQ